MFKSFFFTSFIYFGFWLSLQGQTAWTLNGNGSWGTAGNWSNGDPGSSSEAFFTNNLSAGTIAVNLVAGTKAKSITFGGTNNYTLNNGSLKLGTSGEGFTQDGSGSITINSELTLGVNKTFSGNGSGTVTVNGVISESGPARALTKAGSFTMVMTGNNTYGGGTILSNGILRVQGNNNALGTGGLTIYGGTNEVSGLTLANNINFSGGALRTIGTVASSLFGITTLTSNGTVIADADVTIGDAANELTGAGTLIKLGAERLIINMANNLSGGVWVKEGSLQVNNDAGAGTGTITMDGGTLLSTGNRTFTNNLSILSDSVFSGTGQSFTFNSTLATGVAGSTLRVTNTSGTGTQILAFGNA
ncbi:MAG: autotransporter-associated beta strand repeat-containing protein [Verrucomicrobiota bacterium]|nr:autotransporter-associated beta strand repeat-containing protein [Verrucomicrobiota bacterium]